MSAIAGRLATHPLFGSLGDDWIAAVADCAHEVAFEADEVLFRVDGHADEFFLVEQGRVAIELDDAAGPGLILNTAAPGEIVGVSWILPPYRWTFDARAVEATEAVRFDAACLRGKCDADPALGYALFTALSGLIRDRLVAARLQLLNFYGPGHGGPGHGVDGHGSGGHGSRGQGG